MLCFAAITLFSYLLLTFSTALGFPEGAFKLVEAAAKDTQIQGCSNETTVIVAVRSAPEYENNA